MFVKRHPWALTLAIALAGAISYWLKPAIERLTADTSARIILHLLPLAAAFLFFYLLVRSIEREAVQECERIRMECIGISNQLEISTFTLQRLREENEGLKGQLRETTQKPSELASEMQVAPALTPAVDALNSTWLASVQVGQGADYLFDPIYGAILIDEKLLQVFKQPIVQRLNHIRQLSFSYLTFPTATHSRLAHSLGVCKIAELALSGILARNRLYTAESDTPRRIELTDAEHQSLLLKCKVAALLHDLGHGPFGHALDKYVGFHNPTSVKLHPDKDYSIRYITNHVSETLVAIGIAPGSVTALLDKEARRSLCGFDALIADLIDSPLDVDRIDYLFRDGIMTGLTAGYGSLHTLLEMMRPFVSGDAVSLAFDESAVPAIENLLHLRDFMYVNCYEAPAKLAAERALERIAEEAVSKGLLTVDQLMLLTDHNVLNVVVALAGSNPVINGLAESLLTSQKYEEVYSCKPSNSKTAEVKNWVQNSSLVTWGRG